MPITRSAKKELRKSETNRAYNLRRSRAMKGVIKEIDTLVKEGKFEEAKAQMPVAQKAIDKALKRGIIKKNTAARKKSRLSKRIKKA